MEPNEKIYIAGHKGLVGSAIERALKRRGYEQTIGFSSTECDLTQQNQVEELFRREQPDYVFICAAKVGGIHANSHYPADFIRENLLIQNNLIHQAKEAGVKRLLFLGSSCIYPRDCPQPMKEESLFSGPLEPTNRPYALAKIAGIEMCSAYNRQYGTEFLALMPTNLYGSGDNYHPENSHVIPALLNKMHAAKMANTSQVTLWGTGNPKREFLHSDDLAEAALFLMNLPPIAFRNLISHYPPIINVGWGKDLTIRALANQIAEVVGFKGSFQWDSSKPDGPSQKLLDITKIKALGWEPKIDLKTGLQQVYNEIHENLEANLATMNHNLSL